MLEMKSVDLVIDDASHDSLHQKIAFETIFPFLSAGGIYIIEDIEHSYYYSKHGGYLRPSSNTKKQAFNRSVKFRLFPNSSIKIF